MPQMNRIKQVKKIGKQKPNVVQPVESSEESSDFESNSEASSDEETKEISEETSTTRPRMSQWMDEDEDMTFEDFTPSPRKNIKEELASLSFGAIIKAKNALSRQAREKSSSDSDTSSTDSEGEDEEDSDERPMAGPSHSAEREDVEKKSREKRANKHAPMEMSSKRPVSRKRMVVEVASTKFRDPRFGGAAGDFSSDYFRKDYGFLSDLKVQELEVIRRDMSRAKRLLANSPAHLREERRMEVEKLERTMKRTESAIERSKREAFERDVVLKVKRDERQKRSEGKKEWYLKKSDERKLQLKARFESLSGKEVKKRIAKKQKKMAQKDKKSRPFSGADPKGDNGHTGPARGARRDRSSSPPRKRQRVDI